MSDLFVFPNLSGLLRGNATIEIELSIEPRQELNRPHAPMLLGTVGTTLAETSFKIRPRPRVICRIRDLGSL